MLCKSRRHDKPQYAKAAGPGAANSSRGANEPQRHAVGMQAGHTPCMSGQHVPDRALAVMRPVPPPAAPVASGSIAAHPPMLPAGASPAQPGAAGLLSRFAGSPAAPPVGGIMPGVGHTAGQPGHQPNWQQSTSSPSLAGHAMFSGASQNGAQAMPTWILVPHDLPPDKHSTQQRSVFAVPACACCDDEMDVDDDDLQGGLFFPCSSSAAGYGSFESAARPTAPQWHGHQQLQCLTADDNQQVIQQLGGGMDRMPSRPPATTQHWQQQPSAVEMTFTQRLEALTLHGYQPAAAGASLQVQQQVANTGGAQLVSTGAAAAAAAAQSPKYPDTMKYWDPVFSAAAAAIAAAAGATGESPATAALPWLRRAATSAFWLANEQQQHATAAAGAGEEQGGVEAQERAKEAAVQALRAAFSVDTFSSMLQTVVLCDIDKPELAGKNVVLLGARAQGGSANVHVGLAATPQQLTAVVTVLVSYRSEVSAAISSVISSAVESAGGEQRLLKCADMLATAAQNVVDALPGAVLVAVKVFNTQEDWQLKGAAEYEVLKVLCSDANCRRLVTELLGSGRMPGPVWGQQQRHNSTGAASAQGAASAGQANVIVMEYLPQTLDELLQTTGPASEQQARKVMHRLFQLLSRCHSGSLRDAAGHPVTVVHRDLKAANVLLDMDGNSKVGDWGSATMVSVPGADQAGSAVCGGLFAPLAKMRTQVGTPLWLPGDVVSSGTLAAAGYDSSCDSHTAAIIGVEMVFGGWNKILPGLAVGAAMAPGGLAANYDLYLQQLERLAAGQLKFPNEQQVAVGLGSFRDLLARACGLGCQRHAASFLLQHPWLTQLGAEAS